MFFWLSAYFMSILLFSFVGNAISYCILLVINSLCCLFLIYCISGFSWYALLLYLVYVGGVYILFIFVSVHLPNNLNKGIISLFSFFFVFFLFWEMVTGVLEVGNSTTDYSFNFCSGLEGVSYLFLCLFLLLGFFLVSYISSSKESFVR
uniref:NADH dehydrogenase subunit 6 n=1 Tax=Euryhaliotrema johni TaxID=2849187 RepID=A0A8F2T9R3_9PLAT|nr:NADH dehydrogenase subunit 6 [Euryhaliotrema johni]